MTPAEILSLIGKANTPENLILAEIMQATFDQALAQGGLSFYANETDTRTRTFHGQDSWTGVSTFEFNSMLRSDKPFKVFLGSNFTQNPNPRILTQSEFKLFKKDESHAIGIELLDGITGDQFIQIEGLWGWSTSAEFKSQYEKMLKLYATLTWTAFTDSLSSSTSEVSSQSIGGVSISYRKTESSKQNTNPLAIPLIQNMLKKYML